GLTAVREVLAHRDALDAYNNQFSRLIKTRGQLISLLTEIKDQKLADSLAQVSLTDQHASLLADIDAELATVDPNQQQALRLLRKITENILPNDKNARAMLTGTRKRLNNWVQEQGNSNSPLAQKMARGPVAAASLPPLQQAIDATDAAYDQLSDAVRRYSSNQADSLIRTYQNLTTFETIFGMAQQTFFLLSESNSNLFLDKSQMAIFQTTPSARLLLAGIARERIGRVSNLGKLNAEGVTDFLLDFSLYLSDFRSSLMVKPPVGLNPQQFQRIKAVDFISNTIQALLEAPILQQTTTEAGALSLADRFPAFRKVPDVSRELNELFTLSATGEYRYAVENLLNLIELFDIIPDANKKQQRLTQRRNQLRAQIADFVVEQDASLQAIGLAAPSAEKLQLDVELDKRDEAKLRSYNQSFAAATTALDREDAANSLLDLKVQRIREELQLVEGKLAKLDPQRTDRFRK
ncbi:MAG: hypothetical protein AAF597_16035, partial [Bacteroidota bacterium]